MTAIEASRLCNEYRNLWSFHHPQNRPRALEILQLLRANGWTQLARLVEEEG